MDKSKYFYRTVVFFKHGDKVSVVDLNNVNEKPVELEPWLGIVVSLADGQHTIQELLDYLSIHYQDTPPDSLEKTIDSVIKRLTDTEAVILSDTPVTLPYYLSLSAEQLDIEKARQSMAEDGYIQR